MGCFKACFNRIFGTIIFIAIIVFLVYLFWSYPPWFEQMIANIKKSF